MKLVTKMLKYIIGQTLQGNARHTRKDPRRILPRFHIYPIHHLWQRERVRPRWLLKSIVDDGEDVDRGDEEVGEHLEWGDEAGETGGHGVGSDGAIFGFCLGRSGPEFEDVIAEVFYGTEKDEKFE